MTDYFSYLFFGKIVVFKTIFLLLPLSFLQLTLYEGITANSGRHSDIFRYGAY